MKTTLLPLLLLVPACSFLPAPDDGAAPLQERADRVAAEVARIRDLPPPAVVPVATKAASELETMLVAEIEKDWDQEGAGLERGLKLFGLIPAEMDLKPWLARFLKENIAGYYDSEKNEFFVIEDDRKDDEKGDKKDGAENEDVEDLFVMAHELVHAVDDARFDLDALEDELDLDEDGSLAFTSLVEGSAMEGSLDHLLWRMGAPFSTSGPLLRPLVRGLMSTDHLLELAAGVDEDMVEELADAPPIIERSLIFPYAEGWVFANRLRSEFGWAGIDAAYLDPPESSEQILFPERYIDHRDRPVAIELAEPPFGWRAVHEETLGMFGTRVLLATLLDEEAAGAADGWDGDRWVVWETDDGDVLGWVTVWDYESDARSFHDTYRALLRFQQGETGGWAVERRDTMVTAVRHAPAGTAEEAARHLLESAVTKAPDDQPPERWFWKVLRFPLGVRVLDRAWEAHLLGGALFDFRSHAAGHRFELGNLPLVPGQVLLSENNPDRTAFWLAFGLAGFTSDRTVDYSFARVPFVFNWHGRGAGDDRSSRLALTLGLVEYKNERGSRRFDLGWGGLLRVRWGEGARDGQRLRILFVPIPWI